MSTLFTSCSDDPKDSMDNDDTENLNKYTCPDSKHPHAIDLGLPSGTKWACCNVGAIAPEESGFYFAWGETTTKKSKYSQDTYKYYNSSSGYTHIAMDIVGSKYDAATANLGDHWRMPTYSECLELTDNCTSIWTLQNGVFGRKFIAPNGSFIFLPAAGRRLDSDLDWAGSCGCYWSSTRYEVPDVWGISFSGDNVGTDHYFSCFVGQSVRPVCSN